MLNGKTGIVLRGKNNDDVIMSIMPKKVHRNE